MKRKLLLAMLVSGAVGLGAGIYRRQCTEVCGVRNVALEEASASNGRTVETDRWIVSLQNDGTSSVYIVESKKGEVLPTGLSDETMEIKYPELHRALASLRPSRSLAKVELEPRFGAFRK